MFTAVTPAHAAVEHEAPLGYVSMPASSKHV